MTEWSIKGMISGGNNTSSSSDCNSESIHVTWKTTKNGNLYDIYHLLLVVKTKNKEKRNVKFLPSIKLIEPERFYFLFLNELSNNY